jgi:hypothetical protein
MAVSAQTRKAYLSDMRSNKSHLHNSVKCIYCLRKLWHKLRWCRFSSWMGTRVDMWNGANVSELHAASIIRVEVGMVGQFQKLTRPINCGPLKMDAARTSETSAILPTSRRNALTSTANHGETLKSAMSFWTVQPIKRSPIIWSPKIHYLTHKCP